MKDYSIKDKINYWLDKQMSKGTISMIRLLSFAVVFVVLIVTVLFLIFRLGDDFVSTFWDSLANIINAWMPSSDDGKIGYIVLNTITAIVGLLFTSILIGVVSSAIEEKLQELRNGNSIVLEKDHTIILGYNTGEHDLLKQLILATGNKKRTIVIFTDIEKTAMEQDLINNVDIPKNVEVICRHGDITNVNNLKCCSIDKAKVVIINALNDNRRIKAVLAVSMLKKMYPDCDVDIFACVTSDKYMLPQNKMDNKNITMLKTDDIMAKMIAHTSTEPGLSVAFKEILNFEGNEIYLEKDNRFYNKTVFELSGCIDNATLVGIKHNDVITLNPSRDTIVEEGDEVLLFEISKGCYRINEIGEKNIYEREYYTKLKEVKGKLYIIGNNILLNTIIKELPKDVVDIVLVPIKKNNEYTYNKYNNQNITIFDCNYLDDLDKITKDAGHIVILADRTIDKEDSDINNILLLLKVMNLKELNDYSYNVTVELNMENSHNVSLKNNKIDYIVSSNIASLVLAQMSENIELESVFEELLSNKGNELFSKPIKPFNLTTEHDYSYGGLKQIILSYGYTLLGYSHDEKMYLNLQLEERVHLTENDRLIVLGRE